MGTFYGTPLYLEIKTMDFYRFSLEPIHLYNGLIPLRNVILDSAQCAKLADFGSGRVRRCPNGDSQHGITMVCDSKSWNDYSKICTGKKQTMYKNNQTYASACNRTSVHSFLDTNRSGPLDSYHVTSCHCPIGGGPFGRPLLLRPSGRHRGLLCTRGGTASEGITTVSKTTAKHVY